MESTLWSGTVCGVVVSSAVSGTECTLDCLVRGEEEWKCSWQKSLPISTNLEVSGDWTLPESGQRVIRNWAKYINNEDQVATAVMMNNPPNL